MTFRGEPVSEGDLIFSPDESKGTRGPAAMGAFEEDGSFTLSTETAGDGAIVGFHRVGITGVDPESSDALPVASSNPSDKSALKAIVQEYKKKRRRARAKTPKTPAEIVRGRVAFKLLTPEKLTKPATSGISVEVKPGSNTIEIAIGEDGVVTVTPK
ncbi:MAG: hypothetical protein U0790_10315 [Isosphaeraceae bacterium]